MFAYLEIGLERLDEAVWFEHVKIDGTKIHQHPQAPPEATEQSAPVATILMRHGRKSQIVIQLEGNIPRRIAAMELEMGALIGGLATAAAAGAGLVLTARQIRLSREADERINRWRRVEFVRSVINQLDADDEVRFCLRALDWGVGPLVVPDKHRGLFQDRREVMKHNTQKMELALQVNLSPEWEKSPEILVYRLAFDHFFTAIESIVTYGRRLGEDFIDDVGFSYYKQLIRRPPYMEMRDQDSPISGFVRTFYKDLHTLIWNETKIEK